MSAQLDEASIARGEAMAKKLLAPRKPATLRDGVRGTRKPLILAIGDSWFNYWPRGDLLDLLEDAGGCAIERCASAGRTLAEMLYAKPPALDDDLPQESEPGQELAWLIRRLGALTDDERLRPLCILVSAGGNDVAGQRGPDGTNQLLARMVKPFDGGAPQLEEETVRQLIDVNLRARYVTLFACLRQVSAAFKLSPRTFVHGYDYPVPDGRGVLGRSWLRQALVDRGYTDLDQRKQIMRCLIERLNALLAELAADTKLGSVTYVDLRGTLSNGTNHALFWQNELHPTIPIGFTAIFGKFCAVLEEQGIELG
ncbi:hypothetical protein [Piscinibacter koreensis]|uniref:SGNH hydrolase-type esterase domain-containing protein n=1 Tax=Piscinibacter koreensis TaxID=2742824 RepID=A0A7Y6TW97_9BURK|nr:hypothetical protein [Schlegelella koreensis]NUZ05899.1 hypothetical protein [Schlegelella koreensis]